MQVTFEQSVDKLPETVAAPTHFTLPPLPNSPLTRVERTWNEAGQLSVHIYTPSLHVRSVTRQDAEELYRHVYGSAEVMDKFQNGDPWTSERFTKRLETWVARWEHGDPFSAFSVRTRDEAFVGVAVMGHGSIPGRSELAFAVRKSCWGQGYGKEAMRAIVEKFATLLRSENTTVEGEAFRIVEATVRDDNLPSVNILDSLGMEQSPGDSGLAATAAQYDRMRRLYVGAVHPSQAPLCDIAIDSQNLQVIEHYL